MGSPCGAAGVAGALSRHHGAGMRGGAAEPPRWRWELFLHFPGQREVTDDFQPGSGSIRFMVGKVPWLGWRQWSQGSRVDPRGAERSFLGSRG